MSARTRPVARPALWLALAFAALAGGCATTPPPQATGPSASDAAAQAAAAKPARVDPWEKLNRNIFAFNDKLDNAVLKPVARVYRDAVPALVRTGVSNVLGNIGDVWSSANHFLQGKFQGGLEMGMRVLTNTFFGLGGVLDPATEMKLVRHSEDFGQTLGRWGFANGPYLVLPVIGPSTVRDTVGFAVDRTASVSRLPDTTAGSYAVTAIELISARSELLDATKLLDQAALDRYSFVREGYLSSRRDALFDGAPPLESFDDESGDAAARPGARPPAAGARPPRAGAPSPARAASAGAARRPAPAASQPAR